MIRASIFYVLVAWSLTINATNLTTVTIKQQSRNTAIACYLSAPTTYRAFTLKNPDRAVLDIYSTRLNTHIVNPLGSGLVQDVRAGTISPHTLRLVFDTATPVVIRHRSAGEKHNYVIFLELRSKQYNQTHTLLPKNKDTRKTDGSSDPSVVHKNIDKPQYHSRLQRNLRDVIVVIDPGHGGKDPGAIGIQKHTEKEVVLDIALKLKRYIDNQPGMRAFLTRDGDFYLGLRERLQVARMRHADVFIAIHADAFINQHSHGASVFALSQRGATSEAARWLAEKENYSELGGVNLSGLDDNNGMIRTVLLDLSQTATIQAGLQMGGYILQYLGGVTKLHNVRVEQARFVVLKSPDIASVLIETGFISNPLEARNLSNPIYQARVARAIYEGIHRYFFEHPIQGTRLATTITQESNAAKLSQQHAWFSRF